MQLSYKERGSVIPSVNKVLWLFINIFLWSYFTMHHNFHNTHLCTLFSWTCSLSFPSLSPHNPIRLISALECVFSHTYIEECWLDVSGCLLFMRIYSLSTWFLPTIISQCVRENECCKLIINKCLLVSIAF